MARGRSAVWSFLVLSVCSKSPILASSRVKRKTKERKDSKKDRKDEDTQEVL